MTSTVSFFWLKDGGGWYWQDDDCDEPMGPFLSSLEALADYEAIRHPKERA